MDRKRSFSHSYFHLAVLTPCLFWGRQERMCTVSGPSSLTPVISKRSKKCFTEFIPETESANRVRFLCDEVCISHGHNALEKKHESISFLPSRVGWGYWIHRLRLCRKVRSTPNKRPGYDAKQSDGEALVILGLWGIRNTSSLPSLPNQLWAGVVAPDRVLSMVK